MVKDSIVSIADQIRSTFPALQLRTAFVAYRDYDDAQPVEVLDFVDHATSHSRFQSFVQAIEADGGADEAEDIFSGLAAAASLSWKSANRVLVHMADAPCHGNEFYMGTKVNDTYPGGDKLGRSAANLLTRLRLKASVNSYLFCHLNSSTHRMLQRFKELDGEQ